MRSMLTTKNLAISFEEADYFPWEPRHAGGASRCQLSSDIDYPDFLYALADYYSCDIYDLADTPLYMFDNRLFYSVEETVTTRQIFPNSSTLSDECTLTKVAAHCPTYLVYAECVYSLYIKDSTAVANIVLPEFAPTGTFDETFTRYLQRVKNSISSLLDETVTQLCRFVNTACSSLHPQFKGSAEFRAQHICSMFDVFTPLGPFETLYDLGLPSEDLDALKEFDSEQYEQLFYGTTDVVYSPLGVPIGNGMNSMQRLSSYYAELCERRCGYIIKLSMMTDKGTNLSVHGRIRQLRICGKIQAMCDECDACTELGISRSK
ncbi:penicillin-binding protein 1A, putative [Babesia ovis]|uniref:Penicillin-binding protein 1A, putative n=1 Tax=Babesia ovis TaxID=5869 RepID=A0A9W5TDE6_BABOV|nr:penicillin-binding protein 1A, putative [Babesia ovis]